MHHPHTATSKPAHADADDQNLPDPAARSSAADADATLRDLHPTLARPSLRSPMLADWRALQQIGFRFGRAARHDMANYQTGLQLMETVIQMQARAASATPASTPALPPGFDAQTIASQARENVNILVGIAQNLVFLSQAGNPAAYEPVERRSLACVLASAISGRLTKPAANISPSSLHRAETAFLLTFGDMLDAALSAYFFQWSPGLNQGDLITQPTIEVTDERIVLYLPVRDRELVQHVGQCINIAVADAPCTCGGRAEPSTGAMALCLARGIIERHGGVVSIHPFAPDIRIDLPIAA